MISRRALLTQVPALAAVGVGVWLLRDRIPWPPPRIAFSRGEVTPWIPLPDAGLIEIPGRIEGRDLRVVVDSGAEFSAVDRGLAQALGLKGGSALPLLAYGVSGKPSLTHTVRLDLDAPGLAIRHIRAAVLDLAPVAQVTGRAFSMLLGRDVLRELVADIDFPLRRVRFQARGAYQPPHDARSAPLKTSGGAPMLPVRIEDGPPIDLMIDTGATTVLALSAQAAADAGLLTTARQRAAAPSVSLGGQSLDRIVTAHRVDVAGVRLSNLGVQVYSPSARAKVPAGLIGTGFLRRFRVGLDLGGSRLFLAQATPLIVRGTG